MWRGGAQAPAACFGAGPCPRSGREAAWAARRSQNPMHVQEALMGHLLLGRVEWRAGQGNFWLAGTLFAANREFWIKSTSNAHPACADSSFCNSKMQDFVQTQCKPARGKTSWLAGWLAGNLAFWPVSHHCQRLSSTPP